MIYWREIEGLTRDDGLVLLACPIYSASDRHFLYYDFFTVDVEEEDWQDELDCGWRIDDATYYACVNLPETPND